MTPVDDPPDATTTAGEETNPELAAALQNYQTAGAAAVAQVFTALLDGEVLVPVVARLLDKDAATGAEKRSQMDLLTLRSADEEALVVFSSWRAMQAWRTDVRPVAIPATDACAIAVERDFDAMVIDVAGPVSFTLVGDPLVAIAEGYFPLEKLPGVSAKSSFDVEIRRTNSLPDAAGAAAAGLGLDVVALEIHEGDGIWRAALGVVVRPGESLEALAEQLAQRLTEPIDIVPLTASQARGLA